MQKISLNDIQPSKANLRAEKLNADELVAEISAPLADIEVKQTDNGYEVINGATRLNVQLEVHGSALVRVAGTSVQFKVRRAPDGTIVRL